ncbi:MAG: hypothetical protein LBV48_00810, partial [Mycoplasmataceae bacterium]|nr:hypothetical protein [Mycoplasmataceae bacterium]
MDIKWVKLKSIKDLLDKPHVYKIINLSNKIKSFGKDTSKKPARIVTHLREISRFARNDEFEIYVLYFDTKVQAENMERILHLELLDEIQCTDDVNSEEVLQDKELTKDLKKIRKETT